jgi:triphosphoribosyl-dephospho-CoA synthase
LCAAAGLKATRPLGGNHARQMTLGAIVSQRWGDDIRRGPIPLRSHGSNALRRYGAGGARLEAASGFPSIYEVALPALHHGRRSAPNNNAAARVQTCFALIAAVGDTNLLHRGGADGALYAREAAAAFLRAGGVGAPDWCERAATVHAGFVARRLSPGGCADLLAMTLFVDALQSGSFRL